MKLEDQVCSRDQAKRFVELGIIQGSSAFFFDGHTLRFNSHTETGHYFNAVFCLSAFTVAELGVMLGPHWEYTVRSAYEFTAKTEAEERAHYLIGALESGTITPEEVNNRLSN